MKISYEPKKPSPGNYAARYPHKPEVPGEFPGEII